MRYVHAIALVALSVALVASTADAASTKKKSKTTQMTQNQQIEARHQCFMEAQAAVPGSSIGSGEMSRRTALYSSCAQRKGVRP